MILAGGSGTRFWPASRKQRPKQFLPLADGDTLLAATAARFEGRLPPENIWVATNAQQAEMLPQVLPGFRAEQVVVEPEARDTAPGVALAVAAVAARDPGATVALLPADHILGPKETFLGLIDRAAQVAADDQTLVTFGIQPTHPATGYGYLELGDPLGSRVADQPPVHRCLRFREKPDRATAEEFLASGKFLWNSGMFVWTVAAFRKALATANPELHRSWQGMLGAADEPARLAAFRSAPKISIDFALMEKAPDVAVVTAAGLDWNDVGGFPALADVLPRDPEGNAAMLLDEAKGILEESRNNVVYAEGERTIALFGVEDLVVVALGDAVMVCPKDRADELKKLHQAIQRAGRDDLL